MGHTAYIFKTVNDTALARKMYPDAKDNGDGTLTIKQEYYESASPVFHVPQSGYYEIYSSNCIVVNNVVIAIGDVKHSRYLDTGDVISTGSPRDFYVARVK
jgi:hypothetical protein